MAQNIRSKETENPDACTTCGAAVDSEIRRFVLLPSDDVPNSGSRCEIVVNPAACLRVRAIVCARGHVTFSIDSDEL